MADRSEIDAIKARVDLVSVVEQYVTLKRAGKHLKGLCPFHSEKTPSFNVNPDLGYWTCFGSCGESGDVIKFVEKIENLSFGEALERLALRAGVTLTRSNDRSETASPEIGERDRIYRINALALRYYRDLLRKSPMAQDYLRGRDFVYATEEAFSLGYAAEGWDGLTQHLVSKGISLVDAEKAGLISKSERGSYFDKMRGRVIFPIFDVQERPIAFGARLIGLPSTGQPKYWNSPETPVFSKSRTLYGLGRARKAIAAEGKAIVVEGYTDVITAHQSGFENVVATLGTSLTEEHVKILKRLASNVILGFDADSAGLKAAYRAAEIFEAESVNVFVLDLPEGEDPDSLLRSGKRQVFVDAIAQAPSLIEYQLHQLLKKAPSLSEREQVDLVDRAIKILVTVPSPIERERFIDLIAPYHPRYRVGTTFAEEQIRQEVAAKQSNGGTQNFGNGGRQYNWRGPSVTQGQTALPKQALEVAERHLLRALLSGDSNFVDIVTTGIRPEEFQTPMAAELAAHFFAQYAENGVLEQNLVLASLEDGPLAEPLRVFLLQEEDEPLTAEMLEGEMQHLRQRARKQQLVALKALIDSGNADATILREYQGLYAELKGTKNPRG